MNLVTQYLLKSWTWALSNRIIAAVAAIVVIGGAWYGVTRSGGGAEVSYIPGRVVVQNISTVVSGSGQVSADSQIDLKTKASGEVIYIAAVKGKEVTRGTLLVQLDARDAQKAVRDARVNLESAQLSLEKLEKPATDLELLQSRNDLEQARENKVNAEDGLEKAYEDGFNDVVATFLDIPKVMTGLENILYSKTLNGAIANISAYATLAGNSNSSVTNQNAYLNEQYNTVRSTYEEMFNRYSDASRSDSTSEIKSLILETYKTTRDIADLVKNVSNYIDRVEDIVAQSAGTWSSTASSHQTSLGSYATQTNTHVTTLLQATTDIGAESENILNATRDILEKEGGLGELEAGTEPIDLQTQRLVVQQRQNSLRDAQENLADYYVRAPFDGVVADISVVRGEQVGSGASIGILVTEQLVVEIAMNEVDAAAVFSGQKASLTFDAFEDLILKGEVTDVDAVGTVTQGVVTYGVRIALLENDERIKPGMSVSADITTQTREQVLTVANSAIIFEGSRTFVEVLDVDSATVSERAARRSVGGNELNDTDREERRAQFQNMTEEERAAFREQAQAQGGGNFGGEQRSGFNARNFDSGPPAQSVAAQEGIIPNTPPRRVEVKIGLSDDFFTEILEGLERGDIVVIRTIKPEGASSTSQQQNSILPVGRRGGGGSR